MFYQGIDKVSATEAILPSCEDSTESYGLDEKVKNEAAAERGDGGGTVDLAEQSSPKDDDDDDEDAGNVQAKEMTDEKLGLRYSRDISISYQVLSISYSLSRTLMFLGWL